MKRWLRQQAKRVIAVTAVLLFALLAFGQPTAAQNTQNFTISSFVADYYIGRTDQNVPTMKVEEQIVAEFPQYDQNHGIQRALPTSYKGQPLDIQVQSITNASGQPYQYTTSEQNDNLVLTIGDPNSYAHGSTTYNITYTLKNEISFESNHDELYWDVNGTQWSQPIGSVTARVHIPADLSSNLQDRQVCYAGSQGSNAQDCAIRRTSNNGDVTVAATAQSLSPGSTLTYVLAFDAGTFSVDKAAQQARLVRIVVFVVSLVAIPLVALILVIRNWRKYGRDPKGKGTIIPEYVPPKNLNALTSDVVLHEQLRPQAITALIIELAVTKYLAIYEIEKKGLFGKKSPGYELELTKSASKLSPEQKSIIDMLFPDGKVGARVDLADLKNKLHKQVQELAKEVPKSLFEQGYFKNNPVKARNKYYLWGGLLVGGAGLATFLVAQLWWPLAGLTGGLALSGFILLIAARTMPARSNKGVQTRDYLRGLEMYMKLAEADRIKYLQSPEGVRQWGDPKDPNTKIKLFEKLLPYAMLFGIEKDWAKEFKDIYTEPPGWYHGNWTTFNTIYLIGALNSFGTASAASFAPSSNSSSSGFGGGGFAGGGGGGGGGGGW